MVNKLFSARQLVVPNKGVESPFLGGPSRKNVVVPTLSIPEIKLAVGKPAPPPGRPPSTASARSRDHDGSNDDDDDAAAVPVFIATIKPPENKAVSARFEAVLPMFVHMHVAIL